MPVFSKGFRCTRGSGGGGGGGGCDRRRPGPCPGGSEDEEDDTDNLADASAATYPSSRHNAEFEAQQAGRKVDEADVNNDGDFRFFLTVSDLQAAPPEVDSVTPLTSPTTATEDASAAALEFEHADQEEPPPPSAPRKKRAAAKSSCGRATSEEEEPSTEDEPAPTAEPVAEAPPPPPPAERAPVQLLGAEPEEDFLVLLTGLLAHRPPPGEDFWFYLTVNQAEIATS